MCPTAILGAGLGRVRITGAGAGVGAGGSVLLNSGRKRAARSSTERVVGAGRAEVCDVGMSSVVGLSEVGGSVSLRRDLIRMTRSCIERAREASLT